ncbi:MAG: peptide chain release factor N(5)-glutamine methyltransferase, partial [Bacteroidales bacterium]|nr:peptide chain release factor N(5)-glutamine methyltransferase [Bacteroidales bacterium]
LIFHVRPGVLIPRPETEELVMRITDEWAGKEIRLLDIGTGSVCIAISLASRLPQCKVSALDISMEALDIARENASLNSVVVDFQQKNILEESIDETFDVIVSNPPYVLEREKEVMEQNVLRYEPAVALFVPDADPLLFYRRIATLALQALSPEGTLYFEINQAYGKETKELLHTTGFSQVELVQDCFGKDRIIKAKR